MITKTTTIQLALALSLCALLATLAGCREPECDSNHDCPDGQSCGFGGECETDYTYDPPPSRPPATGPSSPGGSCQPRPLVDCGCWGPVGDQPFFEPSCDSGFAQAQACGGFCPQGGYTYRVSCVCDSASQPEPQPTQSETGQECAQRQWSGASICRPLSPHANGVIDRLTSFWGDGPRQICHYTSYDHAGTLCGPAAPRNAFYCSQQDLIAFDSLLLDEFYTQRGDIAPVSFLAHEWGHLMQHRLGVAGPRSKRMELQADCLSGVFIAWEEAQGRFASMDITQAFQHFCTIADPAPSTWFDPQAHGTCQERVSAFSHGYEGAREQMQHLCPEPTRLALQICP